MNFFEYFTITGEKAQPPVVQEDERVRVQWATSVVRIHEQIPSSHAHCKVSNVPRRTWSIKQRLIFQMRQNPEMYYHIVIACFSRSIWRKPIWKTAWNPVDSSRGRFRLAVRISFGKFPLWKWGHVLFCVFLNFIIICKLSENCRIIGFKNLTDAAGSRGLFAVVGRFIRGS